MTYEIVITGDTNDADYVTEIQDIEQDELDLIMPVIEAVKAYTKLHWKGHYCSEHNWPTSEYSDGEVGALYPDLTEEQLQLFQNFVPCGEYGIHSIESIYIYPKPTKVKLL